MKEQLKEFLISAKKSGYAAGGESVVSKEADSSKSTYFESGDFRFHDNYFGGEPYGGREIVFHKDKPYWIMVYYGEDVIDSASIPTLLKALSNPPEEMPVRGPQLLSDGEFEYLNEWEGDVYKFKGEEKITKSGNVVYSAIYAGGYVDQREG